jgi:hypothetical protein
MIKAECRIISCKVHKLINHLWNKGDWSEEWIEVIIVPIYNRGDKTNCSNYTGISLLPTTYKILSSILMSRLTPYEKEIIGDRQCGFDSTGQLLIVYSAFGKYVRMNGNIVKQCIGCL